MAATVALGTCQNGHGVLWGPVWHVAAATLVHECSVGVSYSDQTPVQGPVTAVLWQQAVGAFGGDEGGVAGRKTKGPALGGLGLNISLLCGGYGFLQLLPGGRESFSNRADTN